VYVPRTARNCSGVTSSAPTPQHPTQALD
jgi:hypothetical protein